MPQKGAGRGARRCLATVIAAAALVGLSAPAALAAPANDAFAAATTVVGKQVIAGTTGAATAELGEPAHAGSPAAHSVWYRYTVTGGESGSELVYACSQGMMDARIAVYTGSAVGTLTPVPVFIASTRPGCTVPGSHARYFTAVPGTNYLIAIDDMGATGAFSLVMCCQRITPPPPGCVVMTAQDTIECLPDPATVAAAIAKCKRRSKSKAKGRSAKARKKARKKRKQCIKQAMKGPVYPDPEQDPI